MRTMLARDDLLSPKQAAAFTGLAIRHLRYLLTKGDIPYVRTTTAPKAPRRIRRSQLLRFLPEARRAS